MATVQPFAGTRYNPEHVKLGGVLAPPYDVISDAQREELYGRDLRNIVRVDYGVAYPDDVDGRRRSLHPRCVVSGLVARARTCWCATTRRASTSSITSFATPTAATRTPPRTARHGRCDAVGIVGPASARAHAARPRRRTGSRSCAPPARRRARSSRSGRTPTASPKPSTVWRPEARCWVAASTARSRRRSCCSGASPIPERVAAISDALRSATLYVADGHHRYETAAAYAAERRPPNPARSARRAVRTLPRLPRRGRRPGNHHPAHASPGAPGHGIAFSLDDLWARLDDAYETLPAADGRCGARRRGGDARDPPRLRRGRARWSGGAPPSATCSPGRRATASTSRSSKPRCSDRPACRRT